MFTGLLGFAMLVGMASASYALYASGSFLVALITYSAAGTCVMMAAMLYVAIRGEEKREAKRPPAPQSVRKAA